jgi:LmbE family N-acetylglucosaminyl deacetylase
MTQTLLPAPEDWRRGLAVVAHPDDIEYCGVVPAWTSAGREVSYLIVTHGEAGIDSVEPAEAARIRDGEQRKSAKLAGVESVAYLDYPDGVVQGSLGLRRDIAAAIRRYRPDVLITLNHHENFRSGARNSPDHRAVGGAALDAVLDAANRWTFPELAGAGLAPWGGVRYAFVASSPQAGHAVDITSTFGLAVRCLSEHHTYLESLGPDNPMSDPAVLLRGKAERVGARFGGRLGVAFEVIPY